MRLWKRNRTWFYTYYTEATGDLHTHPWTQPTASHTHLKHDADIGGDGETLAVGQREQLVVIQHGVEVLHPLRIHVTVKDDPLSLVDLPSHVVNDLPVGPEKGRWGNGIGWWADKEWLISIMGVLWLETQATCRNLTIPLKKATAETSQE